MRTVLPCWSQRASCRQNWLGQMARFRNLLVHLYWQVDNVRVWQVLRNNLGNLDAYLVAVGNVIRERL